MNASSVDGVAADPDGAPPTIRDVAARAQVALSSVSRVLSGHPDVSAGMREKVLAAAADLGYEPDYLAQSLRRGSTKTIGFLLRDISNPLFASIARRCEQELRRAGYSMIIASSDGEADTEAANLHLLRRRRVDGLIGGLVSEINPKSLAELRAFRAPVVLIDREVDGIVAGKVLCDHYVGVRAAVEALLSRGHSRISLVTGTLDVRSSRERLRALVDAHAQAGLPWDDSRASLGQWDEDYAKAETIRLLSSAEPPTAILAGGVSATAGVLRGLRQLRRTVGRDVTVVALDEWPYFDVLAPPLPSVLRDADEMGRASAQLLLDMLGGGAPRTETIDTMFVPRELSGPPAVGVR